MRKSTFFLALFLLTTGVYWNSIHNGFTWDDDYLIARNETVKDLQNIPSFFLDKKNQTIAPGMKWYRPLRSVLFAIEFQLFQLNPAGYHLVNLLVHLVTTFLLFIVIANLVSERHAKVSAIIFSVHPILTESVASITGSADLLCALFFLLAIQLFFFCSSRWTLLFSFLSFSASLLSKEMGVMFPAVLLLITFFSKNNSVIKKKGQRNIGAAMTVFVIITGVYLIVWMAATGASEQGEYYGGSVYTHTLMIMKVFSTYFRLIFFPINQSVRYDIPFLYSLLNSEAAVSLMVTVTGVMGAIFSIRRFPVISFGLFWFFITIFPVSNIVPLSGSMIGERFLYLPSIGLFLSCSDLLIRLYDVVVMKVRFLFRSIFWTLFFLLIFFYTALTVHRNRLWVDNLTLFSDTAAKAPDSLAVRLNLVQEYERAGMLDRAKKEYSEAVRINIANARFHLEWGRKHYAKGRVKEAIQEYKKGIRTNPNLPELHRELALLYEQLGEMDAALVEWEAVRTR